MNQTVNNLTVTGKIIFPDGTFLESSYASLFSGFVNFSRNSATGTTTLLSDTLLVGNKIQSPLITSDVFAARAVRYDTDLDETGMVRTQKRAFTDAMYDDILSNTSAITSLTSTINSIVPDIIDPPAKRIRTANGSAVAEIVPESISITDGTNSVGVYPGEMRLLTSGNTLQGKILPESGNLAIESSQNSIIFKTNNTERINIGNSGAIDVKNNEIQNCSVISSTSGSNMNVEARGTGDLKLRTNNTDAVNIYDTSEIRIYYPTTFSSNTPAHREMQLSSLNFSINSGGYSAATMAKIYFGGTTLNLENFTQSGYINFIGRNSSNVAENLMSLRTDSCQIFKNLSWTSNTALDREIRPSSVSLTQAGGTYDATVRSQIYHVGTALNILNITNSGTTYLRNKDSSGVETTSMDLSTNSCNISRPCNMNNASASNRTIRSSVYGLIENSGAYDGTLLGQVSQSSTAQLIENFVNSGTIAFTTKNALGSVITPLTLSSSSATLPANVSLAMNSGTGVINQTMTTSDMTTNLFKPSRFRTSNIGSLGSSTMGFECRNDISGRGFLCMPDAYSGNLNNIVQSNDCALIAYPLNTNTLTLSNYSNTTNGVRIAATTSNSCSTTLRSGPNSINMSVANGIAQPTQINHNIKFTGSASNREIADLGKINFLDTTSGLLTGSLSLSGSDFNYTANADSSKHIFKVKHSNSQEHTPLVLSSTESTFTNTLAISNSDTSKLTIETNDSGLTTLAAFNETADTSSSILVKCNTTDNEDPPVTTSTDVIKFSAAEIENYVPLSFLGTTAGLREIKNLSTLRIVDGSNETSVYMDQSGDVKGMYYNCNLNSGAHSFTVRNASGVSKAPFVIASGFTSALNTLTVRNETTPSNRFDISTNASQVTSIDAKSATASTSASININCDSVNSSSVATSNAVASFSPAAIEIKRPIQCNYSTVPNNMNHIGFQTTTLIGGASVASNTNIRNLASYTFATSGTYLIHWTVSLTINTGTATFSNLQFAISSSSTSFDTYTFTYPSFMDLKRSHPTLSPSDSIAMPTSCVFRATAANAVAYFNYRVSYDIGFNVTVGGTYTVTRVG